jgi:hypothetical protein
MTGAPEFQLGDRALIESDEGAAVVVTIAAITRWVEGFQPPLEYVVYDGEATLFTVRPEFLRPLSGAALRPPEGVRPIAPARRGMQ